jgi:hypothetical protein
LASGAFAVTEPTVFAIAHEQVLDQAGRHPRDLVTNLIALQTLILRDVASIASDFQSRTQLRPSTPSL